MADQQVYTVESIQGTSVHLLLKAGTLKLVLGVSRLFRKASNEKISVSDINLKDEVIVYKNGPAIVKAELHNKQQTQESAQIRKLSSPQNLKSSTIQPVKEPLIVSLPIEIASSDLTQDYDLKNSLTSFYGGIRQIKSGPSNFPLAFMTGLLDYCLILNRKVILDSLNNILTQFYHLRIDQSQVLSDFAGFFNNSETHSTLLEQVRQFYITRASEIESVLRSLVYITVKLDYYRYGSTEYKLNREESNHFQVFSEGLIEPDDTLFLLERINSKLKVFDLGRSNSVSFGSSVSNRFHLIRIQSGDYYNAFNKQLWFLRTADAQERFEAVTFLNSLSQGRTSEKISQKERSSIVIKELNQKSSQIMNVIQEINTKLGFELDSVSIGNYIKEQDLLNTFKQFCCSGCQKFRRVHELPCSHLMCYDCYSSSYNANNPTSIKCRNCFCLEYSSNINLFFRS